MRQIWWFFSNCILKLFGYGVGSQVRKNEIKFLSSNKISEIQRKKYLALYNSLQSDWLTGTKSVQRFLKMNFSISSSLSFSHTPSALNAGAKRSGATCHMAMPQCCYLAKGAKRPSHATNMISTFSDLCNPNLFLDLCNPNLFSDLWIAAFGYTHNLYSCLFYWFEVLMKSHKNFRAIANSLINGVLTLFYHEKNFSSTQIKLVKQQ